MFPPLNSSNQKSGADVLLRRGTKAGLCPLGLSGTRETFSWDSLGEQKKPCSLSVILVELYHALTHQDGEISLEMVIEL
jgi:hypothetical protein